MHVLWIRWIGLCAAGLCGLAACAPKPIDLDARLSAYPLPGMTRVAARPTLAMDQITVADLDASGRERWRVQIGRSGNIIFTPIQGFHSVKPVYFRTDPVVFAQLLDIAADEAAGRACPVVKSDRGAVRYQVDLAGRSSSAERSKGCLGAALNPSIARALNLGLLAGAPTSLDSLVDRALAQ